MVMQNMEFRLEEVHHHQSANYVPLTPINFLERAATLYGNKTSIVYGSLTFSWKQTHQICLRLASALAGHLHVSRGDIVAAMAPNIPALYKLHFAVPMAGAVLSALNTKLDADILASILEQLEAKIMFVDYQFVELVFKALDILSKRNSKPPLLVIIPDQSSSTDQPYNISSIANKLPSSGILDYNVVLEMGKSSDFEIVQPENENDPISVNYTSGSTGDPKGVVYSHRGAYLNSLDMISRFEMREMAVFLWTVDMFRFNGWCCTWAMAALGGTNICLREVSAGLIFDSILVHQVTHLCGPPTLLNIIANAPDPETHDQQRKPFQTNVNVLVAGVLPAAQVVEKVAKIGFNIGHAYGMTEVLGPAIVRPWKLLECCNNPGKINEGLHSVLIDVKDPNSMKSVPNDGKTLGEVMFKANTLMAPERHDFNLSGPTHLTGRSAIDWKNEDHRRSVVASLVMGVYVVERDCQKKLEGSQALASPWWKSFNFQMLKQIKDDGGSSIVGAIYKFEPPGSHSNLSTDGCPCYVIAFRGTRKSIVKDLFLDLQIIRNDLHSSSRFKIAYEAVRSLVDSVGSSNVWLAGHSLGSAIALLVGRTMAKEGIFLETFLFNPPYPSVPIEKIIKHKKVNDKIQKIRSVITAGALALKENNHNNQSDDPFLNLSAWVPRLFVNKADCLCSRYVEYFKGGIERSKTQISLRSLLLTGKLLEPMHRIPSAYLTVNLTSPRKAHKIRQWWIDQHLESKLYKYE